MALRIAKEEPNGPNSMKVILEADKPGELLAPEAKAFAVQNCSLGGVKSVDPLNSGSPYLPDMERGGAPKPYDAKAQPGEKYHAYVVVNSR